jgi:asparaginyl-tRNA synthetase
MIRPDFYIKDVAECVGQQVTIKGWLYNKRSSGKLHFLQVRDGSGTIQCVMFKGNVSEESFAEGAALTQESSLIVKGEVRADPRSPIGYEIDVAEMQVIQLAQEYPITKKEHGVDFLMNQRHLWLRSAKQHALLAIRAEVINASREYFNTNGFTLLDTPIFTPAACEGTTTLFETEYFGEKAYLAQSGQLYNEACAMAFGKVYTFGPTFRAEKSKTRRHLTEFWMLEPEMAFFDLEDDMDLMEDYVAHLIATVVKNRRKELEVLERDIAALEKMTKPFPRITYDEAIDRLKEAGVDIEWGADFGGEDETILTKMFDKPLLVHRYPAAIKAFYMKRDPKRPELSLSVDMLAPEGYGEIVGGSEREDDLATMEQRLEEHQLPREAFEWYLDLRRYGSVPHSGFGIGLERTVTWLGGIKHLREAIPFPRLMGRLNP